MSEARQVVSLPTALWRGFKGQCPNCSRGTLFGRYLKVAPSCSVCGEDFSHHRADDLPAYLVIAVIGHVVVAGVLAVDDVFSPPAWLQYLIWLPVIAFGALALLQPTKGAVVALQWQLGMHGFDQSKRSSAAARQAVRSVSNDQSAPKFEALREAGA